MGWVGREKGGTEGKKKERENWIKVGLGWEGKEIDGRKEEGEKIGAKVGRVGSEKGVMEREMGKKKERELQQS